MTDILERLRDLAPGYGNVIKDAIEEIERLRMEGIVWRSDFDNAPSPCIGWCVTPAGDSVRQIWKHPTIKGAWSAHGSQQNVKAWLPFPTLPPSQDRA